MELLHPVLKLLSIDKFVPKSKFAIIGLWLLSPFLHSPEAIAFPQYAEWISKKSKVQVNCAYCHINPLGPRGNEVGQLGSFNEKQIEKMHTVDSPVLNSFGKSLISKVGYMGVVQHVVKPEELAQLMTKYDLDKDGVSDGVEMSYGTLANDDQSAPPGLIWQVRPERNWQFIAMLCLAALCLFVSLFGLANSKALTKSGSDNG